MNGSDISNEHIKLFRSLFTGRKDAYGLETQNGPITVREPLADSLIHEHLIGSKRIGIFPIKEDNRVLFACLDLDQEDKEKLSKIFLSLLDSNFYPYVEISKSKGYHIWVFFDEPIEAGAVRRVLLRVLKDSGIDGIEVFPKQDKIGPDNGLGNYVFLPLHGTSIKRGRTLFLDSNLLPYKDQWTQLVRIHRTKAENILALAEKFSSTDSEVDKKEPSTWDETDEGLDVARYLTHYKIPFRIKKRWY